MTNNSIIDYKTGEIVQSGIEYTSTALVLDEGLEYDDWERVGNTLKHIEGAIQWWVGDWLNFGERKYGELYAQALEEDANPQTWMGYKWVSKNIETFRRRKVLSWSHHQEVAALPEKEQELWLDKAEQEGLTRNELRHDIRRARLESKARELPKGKYQVIYADPPWQYQNSGFDEAADNQYPTMPVEEICALRIDEIADDTSVLFLWATNPLLTEALQVLRAWGFEYKTNMAWVKDRGRGKGWYLKSKHELLLIGTKEGTLHPLVRPDSCFIANREPLHSKKPDIVYGIIEQMYPGKKIELFARNNREGWEAWGNEL